MVLTPGAYIYLPERPEWGIGQVQSAVGFRITANFEHAGKQSLDAERIKIELVNLQFNLTNSSVKE